ncbi:MAG: prolyl oligopeptidase family serine peptidase [Peptostreptococcaceae bacterium]|nr:prolyl oligopeptidase family serine peptidase [Peptostreptococcaceae bacterium]
MSWIILILLLVIIVSLVTWSLLQVAVNPKYFTTLESMKYESIKGNLDGYKELEKEDYIIKSYDNYELHSTYIPNDSNKFVIITHGHQSTRWSSVKYLMIYRKLGYSAVIYDVRSHGENESGYVTLGLRESKDLLEVIKDTRAKYGNSIYIGLHGESMGAAISDMVLEYNPEVKFVVSDCGYSNFMMMARMLAKSKYRIIGVVADLANVICKLVYKFDLNEVKPIDTIRKNYVPICFIHGDSDKFIDKINAEMMCKENPGYKELHIFEEAKHAQSYNSNPQKYMKVIDDFVNKVESIT